MTRTESKKSLIGRWPGNGVRVGESEFGSTPAGLTDYRGCVLGDSSIEPGSTLSNIDFSYSSFEDVRLRKNTFNQCVFNATTMKGVDFTACHFGECHFTGCSFARGVWGGGGRNSYSQCSFKKCKLTNSTIAYIEFFACDFENNKFRATFNGTVFEKCKFSGVISDCNFAGGDFSEEQKKYLGVRKLGGFYEVDLGNMSTEMTAFFENFQFHSCVPPKEDVAIIMKREFFLKSVVSFAERHPTHESESRAMISALRLLGDGCTICSKTDVMHFFGERDGARLFDQMRRGA